MRGLHQPRRGDNKPGLFEHGRVPKIRELEVGFPQNNPHVQMHLAGSFRRVGGRELAADHAVPARLRDHGDVHVAAAELLRPDLFPVVPGHRRRALEEEELHGEERGVAAPVELEGVRVLGDGGRLVERHLDRLGRLRHALHPQGYQGVPELVALVGRLLLLIRALDAQHPDLQRREHRLGRLCGRGRPRQVRSVRVRPRVGPVPQLVPRHRGRNLSSVRPIRLRAVATMVHLMQRQLHTEPRRRACSGRPAPLGRHRHAPPPRPGARHWASRDAGLVWCDARRRRPVDKKVPYSCCQIPRRSLDARLQPRRDVRAAPPHPLDVRGGLARPTRRFSSVPRDRMPQVACVQAAHPDRLAHPPRAALHEHGPHGGGCPRPSRVRGRTELVPTPKPQLPSRNTKASDSPKHQLTDVQRIFC
mmetsp:Transcript_21865/g.49310  ORF Transcript_21865/g.49310 Transcript_21865/m.49310 type:complete len:418 (-) Transcript_21865:87-1340(-)